MDNERNFSFSLLQPELLDEEQLREILVSRCVSRNLTTCSKDELVELFRSIALPLPQREYGDSRRERILSKKQQKRRRISISSDDKTDNKRRKISFLSDDTTSFAISSSSLPKPETDKRPDRAMEQAPAERLKAPPTQINFQRKVIRLSDSAKQRITKELDMIVIKNKQTKEKSNIAIASESTGNAKEVFVAAVENGMKQEIVTKNNNVSTAAVKLKRNSSELNNAKQSSEDSKKKEEKPPQKKRQKIVISW